MEALFWPEQDPEKRAAAAEAGEEARTVTGLKEGGVREASVRDSVPCSEDIPSAEWSPRSATAD